MLEDCVWLITLLHCSVTFDSIVRLWQPETMLSAFRVASYFPMVCLLRVALMRTFQLLICTYWIGSSKSRSRNSCLKRARCVQDEELRRAVEEAFPNLDISSSPSDAEALSEDIEPAGASVDPGVLVEALAQSPSTIRQIAQKATASAKADALAQARAALLDPAVISNWDKVVVGDWDPLPVNQVPVRGSFADRRGVVRSAANPPKPHPLTCLSALYREVVALFDPQGIDAILNRRRDEGSIKRSELIELIKRLGEAGANVKKPLAVFRWMQRQESPDLRPLEASYSVMIRLLGKLNAADEAVALLREMEGSGLEQNVQTYNALLSGLAK